MPPIGSNGAENKSAWVAPFWVVTPAEPKEPNMDLSFVDHNIHGVEISVPVLKNKKALKAGDELRRAKSDHLKEPWKSRAKAAATDPANKKPNA